MQTRKASPIFGVSNIFIFLSVVFNVVRSTSAIYLAATIEQKAVKIRFGNYAKPVSRIFQNLLFRWFV